MLLYTKFVNGVRKLFGSSTGIPAATDLEVTFKKNDGTVVSGITVKSDLRDDGHGGMKLNGTNVNAWVGNESVIPKGLEPVVENVPEPQPEPQPEPELVSTKKSKKSAKKDEEVAEAE